MSIEISTKTAVLAVMATVLASPAEGLAQFGVPLSGPFIANTNARTDEGQDYAPQVRWGQGRWISMVRTNEPGGGQYGDDFDILMCYSDDWGLTWTDLVAVNSDASTDTYHDRGCQYVTDGEGNWVLVWFGADTDDTDPRYDVFTARSSDNGLTWTPRRFLSNRGPTNTANERKPQVGTNGQGVWIAVWDTTDDFDGQIGNDRDIAYARSLDNGATWTVARPLNSNANRDNGEDNYVQVHSDGGSTWIVAWQSNDSLGGRIGTDYDIFFTRSDDNGETWSDVAPLNTNADVDLGDDTWPHFAADGAGNWIVVWQSTENLTGDIGPDDDVFYAVSTDNAATWSAPAVLNGNAAVDVGNDEVPYILTDRGGNWVVAWRSNDDLGGQIGRNPNCLVARSTDLGGAWTYPVPLNTNAFTSRGGNNHYPHLAVDERGRWMSIWRSTDFPEEYGDDWDVFGTRFVIPPESQAEVLFVDADATGSEDGSSWADAYTDLQFALAAAAVSPGVSEIWIAEGEYRPDFGADDRSMSFSVPDGVALYGGFQGNESDLSQRDPDAHITTLTGDLGVTGDYRDNSLHVLRLVDAPNGIVLDGLTITGGYADGEGADGFGGGILVSNSDLTINDCLVSANAAPGGSDGAGGGLYAFQCEIAITGSTFDGNEADRRGGAVYLDQCSPTISESLFTGNQTGRGPLLAQGGGAIYNYLSPALIDRCTFDGNMASDAGGVHNNESDSTITRCDFINQRAQHGMGIYNYRSQAVIESCRFLNNEVDFDQWPYGTAGGIFNRECAPLIVQCLFAQNFVGGGGGIYNIDAAPQIVNSTFADNLAQTGGSIHDIDSASEVVNSILWNPDVPEEIFSSGVGTASVNFSNIRGSYPGLANTQQNPQFVGPESDDYRIGENSICIDAGNADVLPGSITTDLGGTARFHDDAGTPNVGIGSSAVLDLGAFEFSGASTGFNHARPAPGRAGRVNDLLVAGADPGSRIAFLYAMGNGSTSVPGCASLVLNLDSPVLLGTTTADAGGNASISVNVPSNGAGRPIFFQAVDRDACRVSSRVIYIFP